MPPNIIIAQVRADLTAVGATISWPNREITKVATMPTLNVTAQAHLHPLVGVRPANIVMKLRLSFAAFAAFALPNLLDRGRNVPSWTHGWATTSEMPPPALAACRLRRLGFASFRNRPQSRTSYSAPKQDLSPIWLLRRELLRIELKSLLLLVKGN